MAVSEVFEGVEVTAFSDIDPSASQLLSYHHPDVPNLGNLKEIDWSSLGPVDIMTAGYPCQPFSFAGKRQGVEDERHIWPYIYSGICEVRPRLILLENVTGHRNLGFSTVLGDLAQAGYSACWISLRASHAGAPHRRERLFILAWNTTGDSERYDRKPPGGFAWGDEGPSGGSDSVAGALIPDAYSEGLQGHGELHSAPGEVQTAPHDQGFNFEKYAPRIRLWEELLGRRCPFPLDEKGNLSAVFVEWMMGLPAGWVTEVPGLNRKNMISLLGNGVSPPQGEMALRILLDMKDQYAGGV
jgi:DNA (cytosine-5)-methyltransferase 1